MFIIWSCFQCWRPPQISFRLAASLIPQLLLYIFIAILILSLKTPSPSTNVRKGKNRKLKTSGKRHTEHPFPVNIENALIGDRRMILSAIHISTRDCSPKLQRSIKQFKLTNRYKSVRRQKWSIWKLVSLLSFLYHSIKSTPTQFRGRIMLLLTILHRRTLVNN